MSADPPSARGVSSGSGGPLTTTTFQPSRLRPGEIIVGASGAVLAMLMFAFPWYGLGGRLGRTADALGVASSVNGWDGLTTLRWLMLATIIVALALVYFQATRAAPALPVSLSVIVMVLALITVLSLVYRVLISVPGPDSLIDAKAGAYLGLACSLLLAYGGYRSLHQEWPEPDPQRTAAIPTVDLGSPH